MVLERESAEKGLETAKEELEIRVELRTLELNGTNDQLQHSRRRVVKAQEELRKSVAQQLHGPVQNRLLVATHWLREAQMELGEDPGKCSENLANATRLIEEINQGELRTAMKRLHPSLIRISLEAALKSLVDQFEKSFHVEIHLGEMRLGSESPAIEDPWKSGLPEELRLAIYRVVEEALNNVLKHSFATRVDIWLDLRNENLVTMAIRDNGCGFDVKEVTPGFGVLSMQDYCGAVGGTLVVQSQPGAGTTIHTSFSLTDDRSASRLDEDPALVSSSISSSTTEIDSTVILHEQHHSEALDQTTTLLLVDDQPDFCGLVRELLSPYEDFRVVGECHDGTSALKLIDDLQPDAVLMDVEMPGLHGLETVQEMRSRFPSVKVVLMSAHHQQEYVEMALPRGASDFIPKSESLGQPRTAGIPAGECSSPGIAPGCRRLGTL